MTHPSNCLLICNANLAGEGLDSVAFDSDGQILAQAPQGALAIDAGGRLVVPAFAEPHVHLDRAFSLHLTGENASGTLLEAIQRFLAAMEAMTVEALIPGAIRALQLLFSCGVSDIRTHTAIGGALEYRAWEAVEKAASSMPGVQVRQVAMPVDPNLDRPEVSGWIREAAARGAVAVGGAPWRGDAPERATRAAAELAAELGIGLDLHVDESDDPRINTLPELVAAVEDAGLGGKAIAVHCCSLAGRPEEVARKEAEALARAGVAVVVCPISNLCCRAGGPAFAESLPSACSGRPR